MAISSSAVTINGHNGWQVDTSSWLSSYGNYDLNIGKNGSYYYPYIMKFTTPSFSGESTSISFSFAMKYRNQLNIYTRYAICSSDSNRDSYKNTTGAVSDSNQLVTGTNQFTVNGNGTTYNVGLTIDTTALRGSTTYYLFIWANSDTGYASILNASGAAATGTISYTLAYKLTISAGTGSTITVNRTSSSVGSTGNLSNGASIYPDDVLKITFGANSGYQLVTHTVNGSTFASGGSHTVSSAVTVVSTAQILGLVYIDNGTTLEAYMVYIDNGTSWDLYTPYIDNGSSWDMYS